MLIIRFATTQDIPTILQFIKDLAVFEKLEDQVRVTASQLEASLFGAHPQAEVILAFESDLPVGFALFFHNFSTFVGEHGLYLEDLYVIPESRGAGVGKALLKRLAQIAVERDCGRFEWWVLDWNDKAISFYKSIGAKPMDEWTVFRVDGQQLQTLAQE